MQETTNGRSKLFNTQNETFCMPQSDWLHMLPNHHDGNTYNDNLQQQHLEKQWWKPCLKEERYKEYAKSWGVLDVSQQPELQSISKEQGLSPCLCCIWWCRTFVHSLKPCCIVVESWLPLDAPGWACWACLVSLTNKSTKTYAKQESSYVYTDLRQWQRRWCNKPRCALPSTSMPITNQAHGSSLGMGLI